MTWLTVSTYLGHSIQIFGQTYLDIVVKVSFVLFLFFFFDDINTFE